MGGQAALPTPSCNYFHQALGLLEIYKAFSLSITFKRCYKEKRKLLVTMESDRSFFLPLLSDLMELKRKLLLGKEEDENWNVLVKPLHWTPSLSFCTETQRRTVGHPVTHSMFVELNPESGQRCLT